MRHVYRGGLVQRYYRTVLFGSALGGMAWLAAAQCRVDLLELWHGLPNGLGRLEPFMHPEWSSVPQMLMQAGVTVGLALVATPISAALSLVLGLAAARNTAWGWVSVSARWMLVLERALPDMFVLLLFVAGLGLGPAPAVLALIVASLGMLGKLFADTIEEVDQQTIDAVRVTGASHSQVISYGVLPPILPRLVSYSLFRFEVNLRAATILGAVAGQGIGYELYRSIGLLEYGRASMAVLVIMLLVHGTERVSSYAREKMMVRGKLA